MHNPENAPANIDQEREWLLGYKHQLGIGWNALGKKMNRAGPTLSLFATGKYEGNNQEIANQIFRHRQYLDSQAQISVDAPEIPGFVETPTAKRLLTLMQWAHRGRITFAATGPGTGKTMAMKHYLDAVANAWMCTMSPSSAGVNNMQIEVLAALGEPDACGTPQKLSRRIRDRIRGTSGLLMFDEAQHLSEKSVEEIRSWYDATGVGIVLFGNQDVATRFDGGNRKAAYAQLFSRVGMRHVQNVPLPADARIIADAWNIHDDQMIHYILQQALKPGGLRGITMMLELATMIASSESRQAELRDLQDAWLQLTSRPVSE